MRNKVKAMSRMMKMFKTLREENESVVQLKGICADGKVPMGLLLEGKKAIEDELIDRSGVFESAKKQDQMNEAMPTTISSSSIVGPGSRLSLSTTNSSNQPQNQNPNNDLNK